MSSICGLHGCPNIAQSMYCSEHLGAGAVVDAVGALTFAIQDLGGYLERIDGALDTIARTEGQLDQIADRIGHVEQAVNESGS